VSPYYDQAGVTIYHGDCRDVLPDIGLVDAVLTDPPYGLKFMGAGWDRSVPGVEFWELVSAVMKPGAHLIAFGGTRTFHRLTCAIEDAGFEILDCLMWLYGTGFPKSKTALKPAWDPIILARKPLEGSVADNVLAHGTGALSIDECRIHADDASEGRRRHGGGTSKIYAQDKWTKENNAVMGMGSPQKAGRWPANVIHDGSEEVVGLFPEVHSAGKARTAAEGTHSRPSSMFKGIGSLARRFGDDGSAARFFYQAKASKADRNTCGADNDHPTVKPLNLMSYLCRLIVPPGGVVLDPFMGSGSTLIAARNHGFRAIGIEIEERFCEIAVKRMAQGVLNFGELG
jgi:DNA modification methylase